MHDKYRMSYTIWTTYHKDKFVEEYNLHDDEHHKLYPTHKPIDGDNINIMNPVYSEMVSMWYVWKHNLKTDYVGFEHYRRRLEISRMPEEGECFIYNRVTFVEHSIYEQYAQYHNKADMDIVLDILDETYGKDNVYSKHIRESILFIPACTFFMKWNDFTLLCDYMFGVAEEYCKRVGIVGNDEEALHKWQQRADEIFKNKNPRYQTRFLAYLMERLISAWITAHMLPTITGIDKKAFLPPELD